MEQTTLLVMGITATLWHSPSNIRRRCFDGKERTMTAKAGPLPFPHITHSRFAFATVESCGSKLLNKFPKPLC